MVVLCEHKQMKKLCQYPYIDLHDEVRQYTNDEWLIVQWYEILHKVKIDVLFNKAKPS